MQVQKEPNISYIGTIVSGLALSVFIALLGIALSPQETPFPTDPYLVLVPIISSGMSFGYWIGYYFKERDEEKKVKIFFTSFFGSTTILTLIFLFISNHIINILIQITSIIFVSSLIISDVIESKKLEILKKALRVFSEDASHPIIFIYLMNWYFGPFTNREILEWGGSFVCVYLGLKFIVARMRD